MTRKEQPWICVGKRAEAVIRGMEKTLELKKQGAQLCDLSKGIIRGRIWAVELRTQAGGPKCELGMKMMLLVQELTAMPAFRMACKKIAEFGVLAVKEMASACGIQLPEFKGTLRYFKVFRMACKSISAGVDKLTSMIAQKRTRGASKLGEIKRE